MEFKAAFARICAALRRRGNSAQDAEDLVQEAWVRLAGYQRDNVVAQPEAFMMRTALNLAVDAHRARTTRGDEVAVEDTVIIDLAPTAEESMLAKERLARLSEGLARLSETSRTILLAHRLDGLSHGEIARARGVSVSTVQAHIAKATLQLTRWMEGW